MRRLSGGFLLAACVLGASACRAPDPLRNVEATAQIEETTLDFGKVPVGVWKSLEIHIRNVGAVPFRLVDAEKLLGNASYEVVFDPAGARPIQPGDVRAVEVRFHPLREGELDGKAQVDVDAEHRPSGTVLLRGTGTPTPIQVAPSALDFQTLEIDSDRTLALTVTNPVDLPLTVTLTGPSAAQFSSNRLKLGPHETVALKTRYAPHSNGASRAKLEVRACKDCTPVVVPMKGRSVPSAFHFDPAPVPFEDIPVHEQTDSQTSATNITWRPVSITAQSTSDIAFVPQSALDGEQVAPGGTVKVKIQFRARASGPWQGTLGLHYTSDKPRESKVTLDARGGRPRLSIAPVAIDFGTLPVGGKTVHTVRLTNAGTHGELHLLGVGGTGDAAQFGVGLPQKGGQDLAWSGGAWPNLTAAQLPIAPGTDYLDLPVYFEPEKAGDFTATLTVHTDDPFHPVQTVALEGHAYDVPPCVYRVDPSPKLVFGNVPPGTGAVLGFRFVNTGNTTCAVKDIHLSDDGGGAFFMPGGPEVGGVVYPGGTFSAMIAFVPKAEGRYQGNLEITVSNPDQPNGNLPIEGAAFESCLVAAPNFLDFGPIRYDCQPGTRTVFVSNQCPYPITLQNAWIGTGTSNQFGFLEKPDTPVALQPGQGVEAELSYARDVFGQHYSPLFFQSADEADPLLVPLLAETNNAGMELEHFIQGTANQLDVLLDISNTTTMGDFQDQLASVVPQWIEHAKEAGVDLRVGVTTTGLVGKTGTCPGGVEGGEAGRLFPVDHSLPRWFEPDTPDEVAQLAQAIHVGTCHDLVEGLETMRAALSSPLVDHADDPLTPEPDDGNLGFLRQTARLAVVVLADEDDHSGFGVQGYVDFLRAAKGTGMAHRVSLSAIVPTDDACVTAGPPGPRFSGVAQGTGGKVVSICAGQNAELGLLEGLTQQAEGLQRAFVLAQVPQDPAGMQVTVEGAAPNEGAWHYDAAQNAVVFADAPKPGSDIAVRYEAVCGNE